MIKNYFITAFRNLLRRKGLFLVNLGGLAIGLTAFIIILMWVDHETSFDRFHPEHEKIKRIGFELTGEGFYDHTPLSMGPLAEELINRFPEVDNAVKINRYGEATVKINEDLFIEENFLRSDTSFFNILGFELETGNTAKVLYNPYSIVITRELANKYFGNSEPIGKTILINNSQEYTVTGIAKAPPTNTHIKFDAVLSRVPATYSSPFDWLNLSFYTYVKFNDLFDEELFKTKVDDLFEEQFGREAKEFGVSIRPFLQPVSSVYMDSFVDAGFSQSGSRATVLIFSGISALILILACINFVNLSTASGSMRSREVAVRKVIGASRKSLIFQFLGESLLFSLFAVIVAMSLVELLLPYFNNLTGLQFSLLDMNSIRIFLMIPVLLMIVGLLSGFYPAFILSGFNPVNTLKGITKVSSGRFWIRSSLTVFQITISVALTICTLFIWKQLNYINNKEMGFEESGRMVIHLRTADLRNRHETIAREISNIPGVVQTAVSDLVPGRGLRSRIYKPSWLNEDVPFNCIYADYNFIDLMGINIVEGRNFSRDFPGDANAIILNKRAVVQYGLDDPAGMTVDVKVGPDEYEPYHIIGIVEDFHFRSVHHNIEPYVIHLLEDQARYITVKVDEENIVQTASLTGSLWEEINPFDPFEYQLIEDIIGGLYSSERRMNRILGILTIIGIAIAAFGIYGLSSFIVQSKTNEIAVRKIFGASFLLILWGIMKKFGYWIIIANLIAGVIAWNFMNNWLDDFAYKISLNDPWVYIGSFLISVLLIIVAAGYQTIKAAGLNPARSLRYE